ncbi:MAG: metallophosphoesterase [Syntrophomonadaceae bacterium]
MKILAVGDIHGAFERLNCLIGQEKPDVILQVGDFGYWPRLGDQDLKMIDTSRTRIYFCEGNNDDLDSLNALIKKPAQAVEVSPRIFYMPRGSVLELEDGRRVLFMGGGKSVDRWRREEGWDWFPEEIISEKDLAHLPDPPVDIIISHTCPDEFPIEEARRQKIKDIDPSRSALSKLLHQYHPSLWYFGHWHTCGDGMYKDTMWVCLNWVRHSATWSRVLPGQIMDR